MCKQGPGRTKNLVGHFKGAVGGQPGFLIDGRFCFRHVLTIRLNLSGESHSMTTTTEEEELLGVVLTPRQIWELLDLLNDAPGDADEDVLDAVANKLRSPRVFTRVSAARYQGRLLALTPDEHRALVDLVENDNTPSDDIISVVGARLVGLVPDRTRTGKIRD